MSTASATPQSARALARDRRRQAWSRNWLTFRSHRAGLVGLGILAGFFLVASFAVILANLAANLAYGLLDPRVRT